MSGNDMSDTKTIDDVAIARRILRICNVVTRLYGPAFKRLCKDVGEANVLRVADRLVEFGLLSKTGEFYEETPKGLTRLRLYSRFLKQE